MGHSPVGQQPPLSSKREEFENLLDQYARCFGSSIQTIPNSRNMKNIKIHLGQEGSNQPLNMQIMMKSSQFFEEAETHKMLQE
jgi:hypothetical protein